MQMANKKDGMDCLKIFCFVKTKTLALTYSYGGKYEQSVYF